MGFDVKNVTLDKIADIQTGPFGSQLHKDDYVQSGTPIVTVEHLGKRKFATQNLPFVSDEDAERLSKYTMEYGDTVFSRVGAVDRCSYVNRENSGWLFSGRCLRIRPRENVYPLYLYYYLTAGSTKQFIRNIAVGATMPSINTKLMGELPCVCPSMIQQKKIATILEELDGKIETNESINKNLEEQAQAIFKSWFVDFEPFGGEKPSDWSLGTLEDLGNNIVCGKTPSTKRKEYYDGEIPFVTIPDMHDQIFITETERYLSNQGAESQPTKTLAKNSVCVSCIGTAGLVSLISRDSQTNQQINSITPKDSISPYYVYFLMKSLSETIRQLGASGSTIVNLNKSQFAKIEATIPSVEVMKSFHDALNPVFELILSNQQMIIRLSALRDTLLPRLISGEIDVSKVEI